MNTLLMAFGGWRPILDAPVWVVLLLKITAILLVAWLVHLALVRTNPRWRVFLWRVTAVGLIALPAVAWLLPALEIHVPQPPPANKAAAVSTVSAAPLADRTLAARLPLGWSDNLSDTTRRLPMGPSGQPDAVGAAAVPQPQTFSAVPPKSFLITWPALLRTVWLGGIAVLAFRLSIGHQRIGRMVRRGQQPPQWICDEYMRVAEAIGCRKRVELLQSADIASPILCGLRRPLLLLPTRMCDDSYCRDVPGIFAHELTHVRSRDVLWNVGLQLLSIVLWFHPLMWRMRKAHLAACELVCDAVSASFVGDVAAYCRTLARVSVAACSSLPVAGIAMARTSAIGRRLSALKKGVFHLPLRRRSVICFGLAALLAVAVLGTLHFALAAPPAAEPVVAAENAEAKRAEKEAKPVADGKSAPNTGSPPVQVVDKAGKPLASTTRKAADLGHEADAAAKAGGWLGDRVGERLGNQDAGSRPSDRLEFRGQVDDPDGKPFQGAKLYLLYYTSAELPPPPLRATSGPDGGFRFTVAKSEFHARGEALQPWVESVVVAVGSGLGIGWEWGRYLDASGQIAESLKSIRAATVHDEKQAPVIRLVRDVPITGRIVDANGRAVAGATVRVLEIETSPQNDLTAWLNAVEQQKPDYYQARAYLANAISGWLRNQLTWLLPAVATDPEGRFRLAGVGRERVARLQLDGPGIATERIDVRTRPGPTLRIGVKGRFPDSLTNYGANFEHTARLSRPIVGLVRDKDTYATLGGVTIQAEKLAGDPLSGSWDFIRAKTDDQGRYRLTGMPIGEDNELRAVPPLDGPYLHSVKPADTRPRQKAIEIDFDLKRGIRIQGRVTDAASGHPVSAQIDYYVFVDNPHDRSAPRFRGCSYGSFGNFYQTDEKGRYSIPGLPGRGIVAVMAHDHERYPRGAGAEKIKGAMSMGLPVYKTDPMWCIPSNYHALAEVNPAEGAKELGVDFVLDSHQRVEGTVLDPKGQPLSGAAFSGRNELFAWTMLSSEQFMVEVYQPEKPRTLLFVQHARKLAGSQVLQGPQKGSIVVRLQPWGAVAGRVVDARGKPQSDMVLIDVHNKLPPQTTINGLPGPTSVTTDQEGRFRIEGLAPGIHYTIEAIQQFVLPAPIRRPPSLVSLVPDVVVQSGETKDLGDLTFNPVKLPGASGQKAKPPK